MPCAARWGVPELMRGMLYLLLIDCRCAMPMGEGWTVWSACMALQARADGGVWPYRRERAWCADMTVTCLECGVSVCGTGIRSVK